MKVMPTEQYRFWYIVLYLYYSYTHYHYKPSLICNIIHRNYNPYISKHCHDFFRINSACDDKISCEIYPHIYAKKIKGEQP